MRILSLFECPVEFQIWDKNSLECVKVLTGHTGSVLCLQYDENVTVTGSSDSTVRYVFLVPLIGYKVLNYYFWKSMRSLTSPWNSALYKNKKNCSKSQKMEVTCACCALLTEFYINIYLIQSCVHGYRSTFCVSIMLINLKCWMSGIQIFLQTNLSFFGLFS